MAEEKPEFPRTFPMTCAPRNGTVITAIYQGKDKKVYWVRNSQMGKDGGSYYDGKDHYKPSSLQGWRA